MAPSTLEKIFISSLFAEYINDESWKISDLKLLQSDAGGIVYFDAVVINVESQERRNIVLDQKVKRFSQKSGEKTVTRLDKLSVRKFVQEIRILEKDLIQAELEHEQFELTVRLGMAFYSYYEAVEHVYILREAVLSKSGEKEGKFYGYSFTIITSDEHEGEVYLIYFD
jgi:hypothetical protein